MKILHITDSHGTVKGPESRKDIYYIAFLKKLYELGYVIRQQQIDFVVHTGDLFHTARISDKFAGQVSELIKSWNVPVYVVPGNHDIEGYTIDTIDQTKIGLLAKTGVIKLLDRDNPLVINASNENGDYSIAISGQEYYAHIDEGNSDDFDMQQNEADLNILCYHGYLADSPQHPNIKCTMPENVVTNADIILCGHYHRQYSLQIGDTDVYNPGSMMRVEQTEYNKTHTPMYGILTVNLTEQDEIEYDYKFHKFKVAQPSTVIFDYDSAYKAKATSITLEGFKNSLASTMVSLSPTNNLVNIISALCVDELGNKIADLEKNSLDLYMDSFNSMPDTFEVKQGYIEAQSKKYITKVRLHNFQSHADTTVEFDNGLNIIVGESNNGKTSILRGIMWVIDNQPLGTDFIMAGENECWVEITFSDGTMITRGRTLKDTGYYKVRCLDENGKMQDFEYRGFTNAVPVEVDNVHQMPKVNITKDIETHLNVLSQLDAPFLLTESPLVKASAIGRITGTHVIDNAIKEANKTIQGNKKIIKQYESDLADEENELKKVPDIAKMESLFAYLQTVQSYLKAECTKVDKCESNMDEYEQIAVQENSERSMLKAARNFSSLNAVPKLALPMIQWSSKVSSLISGVEMTDIEIAREKSGLDDCKRLGVFGKSVEKISSLEQYVRVLSDKLKELDDITAQLEQEKTRHELCSNYANGLNALVVYCHGQLKNCIWINNQAEWSLGNCLISINEAEGQVKSMKNTAKGYKKQIAVVSKQKNQLILSSGVCPCCGQAISEEHIPHIESYLKEGE